MPAGAAVRLSGWGRQPAVDCLLHTPADDAALLRLLHRGPLIARGAGRSYGDSALQENCTIAMTGLGNRMTLDSATGILQCDCGVTFTDMLAHALPHGWFPPVTPGTQFVTIGGAIAADVHGKNHHVAGSIGRHIRAIDLIGSDGRMRRCSPEENAELFEASIGGMGLTGLIRRATLQMTRVESAWVREETMAAPNLDSAFEIFEASQDWTYSVAWIDALAGGPDTGRSIVMRGEHARIDDLSPAQRAHPLQLPPRRVASVPFNAPPGVLNIWTARLFNIAYWTRHSRQTGVRIVDYEKFFYPLDSLLNWNRLYGRSGFMQYQCVLPLAASKRGLTALLSRIQSSGLAPFLAVLKLMGDGRGGMSFPMKGYTLALDFPYTSRLRGLLDELDRIVLDHGGRIYLAKDARMSAETCWQGYSGATAFEELRRAHGAAGFFSSHQSQRLGFA